MVNRVTDSILGTTTTKPATMPFSSRKRSRYSRRRPTTTKRRYKRRRTLKRRRTKRNVKTYIGSTVRGREAKTCYTHDVNSSIGNSVGFGTITASGTVRAPFNLIDNISKGTGINQRDRDCIFLKGIRVELHYRNPPITSAIDEDRRLTYINMAIVVRRDEKAAPVTSNLLRSYGATRSTSLSLTNDWITNTYHPINTDDYLVLMRKRIVLGNNASWAYTNRPWTNHKNMKFYLKLNAKIDYDSAGLAASGIHLIHWYDYEGRGAGTTATMTTPPVFQMKSIAFFKDIN